MCRETFEFLLDFKAGVRTHTLSHRNTNALTAEPLYLVVFWFIFMLDHPLGYKLSVCVCVLEIYGEYESTTRVYGHTTLKIPVLVRSLKSSNVGRG